MSTALTSAFQRDYYNIERLYSGHLLMRDCILESNPKDRFEYETLPKLQRAEILKLTTEIRDNLQKTVHTVWDIGKKLVKVRSQLETWQFSSWLEMEFNWSRRTAYNFISVYEAFPHFSHANFARLDISISALYLLAAPSTPPATRSQFLDRALAGERVSHKVIQISLNKDRVKQVEDDRLAMSEIPSSRSDGGEPSLSMCSVRAKVENSEILAVIPSEYGAEYPSIPADDPSSGATLRPAWNPLPGCSLFWGDTNSPRFREHLPDDAFVWAVPTCQWHHDWLLNRSRSCIILTKANLHQESIEALLSAISAMGTAAIFPWIPSWQIIKSALSLNLKIYVGDPDFQQCQKIFSKLNVNKGKFE